MFSLWYLVLGAKEYRRDWSLRSGKSPPSPPAPSTPVKPDVIPKASDPIPIVNKPEAKTITPAPPKPPRPDVPKPSPPRPAESPKASPPKTPEVPTPVVPKPPLPTPDLPLSPEPPKVLPPKTPESPKTPEILKPQIPVRPSPLSREDELMGRSAALRQPEPNQARGSPVDLSYQPPPPNAPPRYKERVVVSNPDSLESSEAED